MGMVTIPRAEYERLVADSEMLADLAACDAARAEAGEGMPLAAFSRIVSGENPVTVIQEWRGLTQAELARRADLHRVQLHDIETGKSRGSVDTLKAIAVALDVGMDDVVYGGGGGACKHAPSACFIRFARAGHRAMMDLGTP